MDLTVLIPVVDLVLVLAGIGVWSIYTEVTMPKKTEDVEDGSRDLAWWPAIPLAGCTGVALYAIFVIDPAGSAIQRALTFVAIAAGSFAVASQIAEVTYRDEEKNKIWQAKVWARIFGLLTAASTGAAFSAREDLDAATTASLFASILLVPAIAGVWLLTQDKGLAPRALLFAAIGLELALLAFVYGSEFS